MWRRGISTHQIRPLEIKRKVKEVRERVVCHVTIVSWRARDKAVSIFLSRFLSQKLPLTSGLPKKTGEAPGNESITRAWWSGRSFGGFSCAEIQHNNDLRVTYEPKRLFYSLLRLRWKTWAFKTAQRKMEVSSLSYTSALLSLWFSMF